jgi:hypothetical protein
MIPEDIWNLQDNAGKFSQLASQFAIVIYLLEHAGKFRRNIFMLVLLLCIYFS